MIIQQFYTGSRDLVSWRVPYCPGMVLTQRHATGPEYLRVVTDLLQRIRLADPEGGVWEAADMQWAWRKDQHSDPANAIFWVDEGDRVVAAAVLTNFGDRVGTDLLVSPDTIELVPTMWASAMEILDRLPPIAVEADLRDDDIVTIGLATEAGFQRDEETAVSCWLDASKRPQVSDLASGYRLRSTQMCPRRRIT
jgi:hypothetical protein